MDNHFIAQKLLHMARTLAESRSNLFRVRAYRRAAETIRGLDRPLEDLLAEDGRRGLRELPGIGNSLSATIETLVRTGDITRLTEEEKTLVMK